MPEKSRVGLIIFGSVLGLAALSFLLNLGGRGGESSKSTQMAATESAPTTPTPDPVAAAAEKLAVAEAPPAKPPSPWSYSDLSDAMHDKTTKTGCTTSTNEVRLKWPYKNVTADLCIRRSPRFGLDAYVQLNGDGQVICRYDSCAVRVRFDTGEPRRFSASEASDNSSNIIFINGVPKLIAGLKKSDRTVIEIEFYEAGYQMLEFNTQQFEW